MTELALAAFAACLAGALNTLAGGGTFLTFPVLVWAGLPPVAANATSAVAVFPGYLGGSWGFRRELAREPRPALLGALATALAGGLAGGLTLLVTPTALFDALIPVLLLIATLAFLAGQRLRRWLAGSRLDGPAVRAVTLFAVCFYGGYFNGGVGILLLALFALWGRTDIHRMNALKMALSVAIALASVAAFLAAGLVDLRYAAVMAVGAILGGWAGAPLGRALPDGVIRAIVVAVGALMTALFAWRAIA